MTSQSIATPISQATPTNAVPQTARGRALYTVDWFLNGKPVLRNHDNPRLNIKGGWLCRTTPVHVRSPK